MPQIDIMKLCDYFEKSSLTKFEYSNEKEKIVLEKQIEKTTEYVSVQTPQTQKQASTSLKTEVENPNTTVTAPLVGVFYAAPSPNDKPFVNVGDKVEKGQILCLLEAMKMMSEVTSPVNGVIKKINFANEDVVGFGDVLFEVL